MTSWRRALVWLFGAAAIAAVLLVLRTSTRPAADPIASLVQKAPRDHRLVEARLAGFPWARLRGPGRGSAAADPEDLLLTGAAGNVLQKTEGNGEADARRAAGVAYVLIGRAADGVSALEQAAKSSNDWRAWNDLAAARHTLAVKGERPSELPQALADVDRALRLSPQSEALFNRALIIESLQLREQALAAWQRFLAAEPASEWSVEAREHLRRLEAAAAPRWDTKLLETMPAEDVVRQFPQEARREVEVRGLGAWADAEAANDAGRAAAALARARAVGDALVRLRSEQLLADSVAAVDGARGAARAALVEGHHTYRAGRIDYSKRGLEEAEAKFRRAAELLAQGRSPSAEWALYYAASAAFDQGRVEEARGELAALLARIDADRYRALAAEIHLQLAVCANTAGDWGTGTREADTAAAIFRALGERKPAAFADGTAAMAVELIGENDLAWQRRLRTFGELSAAGDPRLGAIIHSTSMTLAAVGRTEAAASMIELRTGESAKADPAPAASSYADAARYAARSGDAERARQSLEKARASAARVTDPALRKTIGAQIALADATLGDVDRSSAIFAAGQTSIDLPDAYLQRARALRSKGDAAGALAEYGSALREVERQRATVSDAESRLRFLDVAAQIIEETTDLRVARGDVRGAFAVADRGRALIDAQPIDTGGAPIPSLGPDVLVVEYAMLPRSVVAFCLSQDGVAAVRIAADRRELESRIAAFAERMRRRAADEEIRADAAALYRTLIEPLQPHLGGVRELVIIPDRRLYAVPFAALWNAQAGRYLVEDFTLRLAPSATYQRDLPPPAQTPALVVADPPAAGLPPLRASREEASGVAAMYGATLLTGEEATRAAFVDAARGSALIHFAGHANSDATTSHAALLLADAGNVPGVLGASDVARLVLQRNPLVVLAACGSVRGDPLHVSGMSSLARAFLLAGARGVVGTLWEIDDDVSARLFVRFHAHLRAGLPPSRALREAQLDTLHSSDRRMAHPATWSPVVLLTDVQPSSGGHHEPR